MQKGSATPAKRETRFALPIRALLRAAKYAQVDVASTVTVPRRAVPFKR